MANVHCPQCKALNPEDAERCWNCQANLFPEESKKEESDWLDSLRGEDPPEEISWESGEESSTPEPLADDASDWLSRIRDNSTSEPGEENLPSGDWSAFSDDAEQAQDLPDWLKDMSGEGDQGATAGADDWLSSFSASEEQPAAGSSSPNASDNQPAAGGEPEEDWLKELQAWQTSQAPGEQAEPPAQQPVEWQAGNEEPEPPAGAQAFPAPEDSGTSDLDWLKQLSDEDYPLDESEQDLEEETPQEPASPAPFKMEDDGGVNWLSRFSSADAAEQPTEPPAEGSGGSFTAGWDIPFERESSGQEQEPEEEEQHAQPAGPFSFQDEEEEDDWKPLSHADDESKNPDNPEELPAWLFSGDDDDNLLPSAEQPPSLEQPESDTGRQAQEPPAFEIEPGELPDWLTSETETAPEAELPAEEPRQPETTFAAEETPVSSEAPETLEESSTPPETPAVAPFTPFAEEELPAWLSEDSLEPPAVEPVDKPAFVFDEKGEFAEPVEPDDHPFAEEEMPEWLESSEEGEAGGDEAQAEGAEIAPAQLPGWLEAMRPVEAVVPGSVSADDSRAEKSGPLAGLAGTLPSESISSQYRKPPVYSIRLHVSDKQRAHATMLEESIADESKPSEVRAQRKGVPEVLLRLLVAIALIAILLFSGALRRAEPVSSDPSFGYVNFRTQVDNVTQGAPVLVAFEYNPAYSAEMRLAASGVLEQLMRSGARITAVSTTPAGPVLADDLLRQVADAAGVPYTSDRFVNLGYLAGGTLSLQEFAIRPQEVTRYQFDSAVTGKRAWDQPALQGVQALDDFSLAIVMTETPDVGRAWVEQVAPFFGETPLLMITSAQAAPMLQPYVSSGQVDGLLAGLLGGSYFAVPNSQSQVQPGYWTAFYAGVRIAIALIVLGALFQGILSLIKGPKA